MSIEVVRGCECGCEVAHIAKHLRAADRQELETASGMSAEEALYRAWEVSTYAWVARIDNEPAVCFGVVENPNRPGAGVIWMVGTDKISKARLGVLKKARAWVDYISTRYPYLYNRADCRNTLHLRWLRLLGFTFDEVVEVNGHPFQWFHMNREESPCAIQ